MFILFLFYLSARFVIFFNKRMLDWISMTLNDHERTTLAYCIFRSSLCKLEWR